VDHRAQEQTISFLLNSICRAQRSSVSDALALLGLYAGQETFLWQLWREDGLTQSQIVERMCVQPPTVSKMLDRMEKTGLVTRRPDPNDSRVTRVYLTEQGRAIEHRVCDAWYGMEDRLTANLSADEQAQLRRLLLQVHANLSRDPSPTEE
jgi:DNA-binding MarR family transcriptional regulator